MEELEPWCSAGGTGSGTTATMGKVLWFLKKLKIKWPCGPAVPLLGIHREELKVGSWDIWTPVFTAASRQKQPVAISGRVERQNMEYTHSEVICSLKKEGLPPHATTWMHLEGSTLSDIS